MKKEKPNFPTHRLLTIIVSCSNRLWTEIMFLRGQREEQKEKDETYYNSASSLWEAIYAQKSK